VFLGLDGIVVKSHGGTDALGFATAVDVAVEAVRTGLVGKIKADVALMTGILRQSDADP
jgi:glycerol-3-phosphate acyltransferase PlsX